jgi:type I restriction enzyme M protein
LNEYEYDDEFAKPMVHDGHPSEMDNLELYEEAVAHLKEDGNLAQQAFDQFNPLFNRRSTFVDTVQQLERLEGWGSFGENADLFGDAYEYLLEKYADKAEGAGEYFTPRPLTNAIVRFVEPQVDDEIIDPASGTNGFLIQSYNYLKEETDNFAQIRKTDVESQFASREIRTETYRLGLLNYLLHDIDPSDVNAMRGDSLREEKNSEQEYDLVLANPPFGSDISFKYNRRCDSSIEMNFLMMMMDMIGDNGRAGIVIPEGILFDSDKEPVREELLGQFDINVILALPEDTFQPYSYVDANVLFFERDSSGTDEFWFYDARSEYENIKQSNPLSYEKHFNSFVENKNNREDCNRYFKVDVDNVDTDGYELHLTKHKEHKYDAYRPSNKISADIKNELESLEKMTDESVLSGGNKTADINSEIKSVGDIADVVYGDGLPKDDREGGDIPVYGSGGVTGFHNEPLEKSTSVILGRKGSINKVHYVEEPFWAIDTTFYVKAGDGVEPKYLYYFFEMYDLSQLDTSSTIPSLRKGDIVDIKIPVPTLREQRAVVDEVEERIEYTKQLTRKAGNLEILLEEYSNSSLYQVFSEIGGESTADNTYTQQRLIDEDN